MEYWVLKFDSFKHVNGRRYRQSSTMVGVFSTRAKAQERVDILKTHADPSDFERRWGARPFSYDYNLYRVREMEEMEYAILAGTTANLVKE